jgi:hypothetical protein
LRGRGCCGPLRTGTLHGSLNDIQNFRSGTFNEVVWDISIALKIFHRSGCSLGQSEKGRIGRYPISRQILNAGLGLSPFDQISEDGKFFAGEFPRFAKRPEAMFGGGVVSLGVGKSSGFFESPLEAIMLFQSFMESLIEWGKRGNIGRRVLQLLGSEGATLPIRSGLSLGDRLSQQFPNQAGQGNMIPKSYEGRSDLCVKQVFRELTGSSIQDFEVLVTAVNHFEGAGVQKQFFQRGEVGYCQDIDQENVVSIGDLKKTEFWDKGSLAYEFGVETEEIALG